MTNEEALNIENGFVDFVDRDDRTNAFRAIMNMMGYRTTYQMADLILEAIALMDGDEKYSNIRDLSKLQVAWHNRWKRYFEKQNKND